MKFEPLSKNHLRNEFCSGQDEVDLFLRTRARKLHAQGPIKTYVWCPGKDGFIGAFYSLTPAEISPDAMDKPKKYPPHRLGCYRLVWIGVDQRLQGRGLGRDTLVIALRHAYAVMEKLGGVGVILDAIDEKAAAWYRSLEYMWPVNTDEADFIINLTSLKSL